MITKEIQLPVHTDKYGCYIFDAGGKMLAQVRGFGWIKQLVGEEKAPEIHLELAEWLVNKINTTHTNG